jgi:hypothetical protein
MAPVVLAALLMTGAIVCVDGHGYLAVPKSRNLVANGKGLEYCPHCLNSGSAANVKAYDVLGGVWDRNYPETEQSLVRHGLCGDNPGETKYMLGGSIYGSPAGGNVQATYTSGQSIDINVIITAHHMGWWQVYLCDKGDALTQDCLNKRMLLRDPNDPSISPLDARFPGRYYMVPTCYGAAAMNQTARYKLPAGLTCTNCVLQWYWVTANTCHGGGYTGVTFPAAGGSCGGDGGASGWLPRANSACVDNPSLYPEEFWNCADVRIVAASGPTPPPTSTSAPAPTTSAPAPTTSAPAPTTSAPAPTTRAPAPTSTSAPPTSTSAPPTPLATTLSPTATASPTTRQPTPTPAPTTTATTGKPTPAGGACSALWGQCGGQAWAGATCCTEGAKCVGSSVYYSQCVVDTTATCLQSWADCTKAGSRCCAGSACVSVNNFYKLCQPL